MSAVFWKSYKTNEVGWGYDCSGALGGRAKDAMVNEQVEPFPQLLTVVTYPVSADFKSCLRARCNVSADLFHSLLPEFSFISRMISTKASEPRGIPPANSDEFLDTPSHLSPLPSDLQCPCELPNEIQQIIFQNAASLDGRCALRLCQVARYVYVWVHPILYQRVVIQSPQSAISFFQTLRSKPRGYFEPMIRSLTFSSTVSLPQARALLVECSKRILLLTVFRKGSSREKILDYVKSPYLKRLTMVCYRDWPADARWSGASPQYEIPLGIIRTLTHLTIVVDYEYGTWFHLGQASLASAYPDNPRYAMAHAAFQNLTHVAVSLKAMGYNLKLRRIALKLRYFAVLEPSLCTLTEHERLIRSIRALESDPAHFMAKPQSMVVLQGLGDPDVWKPVDSFRPSDLWGKVERLVDEGYISDRGERW